MSTEDYKELEAKLARTVIALESVHEELEWAYDTAKDKLKFGMPESEAIKHRESRYRGVFLTTIETVTEALIDIKGEE